MTVSPLELDDLTYMRKALEMASQAFSREEVPVGAVLVKDGDILALGFNQREKLQDPTAHAEILAIRSAAARIGSWRLTDTTLYVTLEPCAMCAGAIIQSRVKRVVFGAWDSKAGACGSICDLTAESRWNHRVVVETGLLADDSRALLQRFFQLRRGAPTIRV